jgi:hypothetical protein
MFSLYLGALESFFFSRAQLSWVLMLFAVFILHYLARFRLARSEDGFSAGADAAPRLKTAA